MDVGKPRRAGKTRSLTAITCKSQQVAPKTSTRSTTGNSSRIPAESDSRESDKVGRNRRVEARRGATRFDISEGISRKERKE